ncbi:MAG: DUF4349 domain-containing protein [Bacteroidia bacterium]|nr:DUF4349 domain-containing protein [Bacteroidia bacterium]
MKKSSIILLCLLLSFMISCDRAMNRSDQTSENYVADSYGYDEEVATEDYEPEEAQSTYKEDGEGLETGWVSNNATYAADVKYNQEVRQKAIRKTNEKIIKKGNIGIQLEDYARDKHPFYDAIRKYDGYISMENETKESARLSNTMEIRVPNENFDKLVETITTGSGIKNIDYKRTSAVDVGEEYYDLQTRIRTKKEVEKRYIEILKKSTKIKDILAVEDQIRVIREEIESKEGRLRFLSDRIAYSTINLYLYQNLEYNAPLTEKPTFWGKLANASYSGWNAILNFLLFLTYIWPILILLGVVLFLYKRKRWIFKKKS